MAFEFIVFLLGCRKMHLRNYQEHFFFPHSHLFFHPFLLNSAGNLGSSLQPGPSSSAGSRVEVRPGWGTSVYLKGLPKCSCVRLLCKWTQGAGDALFHLLSTGLLSMPRTDLMGEGVAHSFPLQAVA